MTTALIDIAREAVVLELVSPAFRMRYPPLHHAELIPPEDRLAMEASWNKAAFPESSVTVSLLHDVYVAQEGLVFDASGAVFRTTITQHTPAEIEHARALVVAAIGAGITPVGETKAVLCKKRGVGNFGHWLMEMLPKAYVAKLYLGQEPLAYVVPRLEGQLGRTVGESMAMLGIADAAVIPADATPILVPHLLVVDGLSQHGVFMSPLVMGCIDGLAARIAGAAPGRVFVSRAGSVTRRLINEAEVEQRALDRGCVVIDPATMSLAEQIAIFKSAREVVGVMGAAMTNIAFAPPFCRIVNLAPASMRDTFFWFIAGLRHQDYQEIRCAQDGPSRGVMPWDTDIVLAAEDFDLVFPLAS